MDQAFALLEFVGQVRAVDIIPGQIALMRQRTEVLRIGDYEEFIEIVILIFVEKPQGLARIRSNLDNLVISEPVDIIEMAQTKQRFSKIYLSNVLGHSCYNLINENSITEVLRNRARNLPRNGLVYVANHSIT